MAKWEECYPGSRIILAFLKRNSHNKISSGSFHWANGNSYMERETDPLDMEERA